MRRVTLAPAEWDDVIDLRQERTYEQNEYWGICYLCTRPHQADKLHLYSGLPSREYEVAHDQDRRIICRHAPQPKGDTT